MTVADWPSGDVNDVRSDALRRMGSRPFGLRASGFYFRVCDGRPPATGTPFLCDMAHSSITYRLCENQGADEKL